MALNFISRRTPGSLFLFPSLSDGVQVPSLVPITEIRPPFPHVQLQGVLTPVDWFNPECHGALS